MSLPDIIARLEKATGPDRELDCRIGLSPELPFARGLVKAKDAADETRLLEILLEMRTHEGEDGEPATYTLADEYADVPRYTASLDDALTLVPDYKHGGRMLVDLCIGNRWSSAQIDGMCSVWTSEGCPNAAIALCIAALRARHADPSEPEGAA